MIPPEKTFGKLQKVLSVGEWAEASRGRCPLCGCPLEKRAGKDSVTAFVRENPSGRGGRGAVRGGAPVAGDDNAEDEDAEDGGDDASDDAGDGRDAAAGGGSDFFDTMDDADIAEPIDKKRRKSRDDLLKTKSLIVRRCIDLSEEGLELDEIARKLDKNVALVTALIRTFNREFNILEKNLPTNQVNQSFND
ncbi:MAG: hypothetical protein ABL994_21305 [Verrucomicrobiales bacterium]